MQIHCGTTRLGCYVCVTLVVEMEKRTFYLNPDTGNWHDDCRKCWFEEERKAEVLGKLALNLIRIN